MSVGMYPITRIPTITQSLANQGYQLWYWRLDCSAFDCPIEPLTQEFWKEKRNACLAHALVLPAVESRDGGDLLILVTQNLNHAKNREFGSLTVRQRYELFDLIMMLDFPHGVGFKMMPRALQIKYFKEFEAAFAECILPKKNDKGEYFREPDDSKDSEPPRLNAQGTAKCTNCGEVIAIGNGLLIMESFHVDDGSILVFGVCERCESTLALKADALPK